MKKGVLYPNKELDLLNYYSRVSPALSGFLKNKTLATKIHLPNLFFIRRGSDYPTLFVEDLLSVNPKMIKLRKNHLKDVRSKISKKQELIWIYFPPRKMIEFFYATNSEGVSKSINRIFIDIDRRKNSPDDSRIVALELINTIKKDKEFNKLGNYQIVIIWTGSSFHVYLLLKKPISVEIYNKYLSYGHKKAESFIEKWAKILSFETKINVQAGHEKSDDSIILDTSQTPLGKLARAPFSIHLKNYKTIDGVSVPVSFQDLSDLGLIKKLKKLNPEIVLKDLERYGKLLR